MMGTDCKQIGGRICHLMMQPHSRYLLIQMVDDHDLEELSAELEIICRAGIPFSLCAVQVSDWFSDLSPWEAQPVFGKQAFGSGAGETLTFIETELIPAMYRLFEIESGTKKIIGGYSLAGLFALFAAYESSIFEGCAAVSPSVWFEGWDRYAEGHTFGARFAYLSLGNREEKTRNRQMALVGERIRVQAELLKKSGVQNILEWNEGNHFQKAGIRTGRGFEWLITNMNQTEQEG